VGLAFERNPTGKAAAMSRRMKRRSALGAVSIVVVIVTGVLVGQGAISDATQGQAVIAGTVNTATQQTVVNNTGPGLPCDGNNVDGLMACGDYGITGRGKAVGVYGQGYGQGSVGLYGTGSARGITANGGTTGVFATGGTDGVYAEGTYALHGKSLTEWAVWGEGETRGVYGISNGEGVVGFGNTVGVRAEGPNIALRVKGKAEFSRSGLASVNGSTAAPKSSIRVSGVALTAKSMVLVTPQKNVGGVWVQGAVPNVAKGFVTIFLNETVTAPYPVAWMVVERP
jgi:hypothetical protein